MTQRHRLLVVDDEAGNRALLSAMAESLGYRAEAAADGREAVARMRDGVDLVLLDALMPQMDGYEVLRQIRSDQETCDLPVIMVTGMSSKEDRLRAAEGGANDFIGKPVDQAEFRVRVASLLKMKDAQDAVKEQNAQLEAAVNERTADLRMALKAAAAAQQTAQEAALDTVERLAVAAEFKDQGTAAHIRRISRYCKLLAEAMGLGGREAGLLPASSTMHDVGKIGIPDAILLKPGKLDPREWEVMKEHASIGARILGGSSSAVLRTGEVIALSHHERWDGRGYPRGLRGEDIPLPGRICAVADVFDALTSDRPYRASLPPDRAVEIMREGRGSHFDPQVMDVFLERTAGFIAVRQS
jgi:putative two-component system response regulator